MVFQKSLHPCALDENSLSIGRVNLKTNFEPSYIVFPSRLTLHIYLLVLGLGPKKLTRALGKSNDQNSSKY